MIERGDKLLWGDMPGVVEDVQGHEIQAKWDAGYSSPFSGGTFWGAELVISLGQIEVLGGNGHKPVPALMEQPVPSDLFERAFRLSFEL